MDFNYVFQQVLASTKRPDKAVQVAREINAAITFFSADAEFEQDIVEQSVVLDPNQWSQAFPLTDLPRFRKFDYLKYGACQLKQISPSQLFTAKDIRNRWYQNGSGIVVNLGTLTSSIDVAYFQYPEIQTPANPNYWMFTGGWNFIFDRVCAKIFEDIGDTQSSERHERYAVAGFLSFRTDRARKQS